MIIKKLQVILKSIFVILVLSYNVISISYAKDTEIKKVEVKTFTFSPVPQFEQRKLFSIWSPILEKLEEKTGHKFEFVGSKDINLFGKKLKYGEYDISYANPFQTLVANKEQGYTPLIRSGKKKLQGIIVSNKKNKNSKIEDLDGKVIAFPDANALAASMLLRAELKRIHDIDFKPIYVKTHSSVYLHVAKNFAYAGGGVNRTFKQQKDNIKDKLEIIYKSKKVSSHPILVHPRIGKETIDIIQNALLEINKENPELFREASMEEPIKTSIKDYVSLHSLKLEEFYVH